MPDLLTIQSTVQCPHGGTVLLTTANVRVAAGGAFALVQSDVSTVVGCPFTVGTKYSPCVLVQWTAGAVRASAVSPILTMSSIGICHSPEGAPQGVAIIANTQTKVAAQ
jgi:hypothetical protein